MVLLHQQHGHLGQVLFVIFLIFSGLCRLGVVLIFFFYFFSVFLCIIVQILLGVALIITTRIPQYNFYTYFCQSFGLDHLLLK